MSDFLVGFLIVAIGLLFCYRGQVALRTVISLWGGLVGFWLGAVLAAQLTGEAMLTGASGWGAALVGALLLGWLAYGFYVAGVIITMASIGYSLGTSAAAWFGNPPGWVNLGIGLAAAVLLVVITLATNLPRLLLVIATALGGASAVVTGLRLLVGTASLASVTGLTLPGVPDQWWWTLIWIALAISGIFVQSRTARGGGSVRDAWRRKLRT